MNIEPRKLYVGRDSVVMGDVAGRVGDGSVVIGPTDNRGNVILNQPMAVGRGAFAGPNSIAIGAGAGAGSQAQLSHLVNRLADMVKASGDDTIVERFNDLVAELEKSQPDTQTTTSILNLLKNSAALDGVWSLIDRILGLLPDT